MSLHYVTIHYGPTDTFNNVTYKPQRLTGLKGARPSLHHQSNTWPEQPEDLTYTIHAGQTGWRGLMDVYRLQKLGYRVDLVAEKYRNHCVLEVCGHEVFRCNIKNLMFNTPYYRDPVCMRAVNAVVESSIKFLRARSCLWFWTVLESRVFQLGDFEILDHWPEKYNPEELKSYAPISTCAQECCGILTKANK